MLNMNSPTVQNLMQSGFNPYTNSGYIPQQQIQQPMYYNPYMGQPQMNYIQPQQTEFQYCYDPMPKQVINEARGINTEMQNNIQPRPSNNYYGFNSQAFNGYMNPFLMRNQMEAERIRYREESIQQGKIWRMLLQGEANHNEDMNLDEIVHRVESLYYFEPYQEELSLKEKMIMDKNARIAEIDARADYYRTNNIQMPSNLDVMRANIYGYYNKMNQFISEDCGMMEYFSEVFPQLRREQLLYEADKFNKNLKNQYNSSDFNKLIDKVTGDKSDSYYSKLMETYADSGVKLETSSGLVITADEMEVKLPERLLRNKQDEYYEKRRKFFNAIFQKEA